jgi:hypothetical protein
MHPAATGRPTRAEATRRACAGAHHTLSRHPGGRRGRRGPGQDVGGVAAISRTPTMAMPAATSVSVRASGDTSLDLSSAWGAGDARRGCSSGSVPGDVRSMAVRTSPLPLHDPVEVARDLPPRDLLQGGFWTGPEGDGHLVTVVLYLLDRVEQRMGLLCLQPLQQRSQR